jgi:hypothetical protein
MKRRLEEEDVIEVKRRRSNVTRKRKIEGEQNNNKRQKVGSEDTVSLLQSVRNLVYSWFYSSACPYRDPDQETDFE